MEFAYRDIIKERLTPKELMDLASRLDGGVKALLNLRSRNLKELQVDPHTMSDEALAQLMSDNPKTMIRPLYGTDEALIVGYDEVRLADLL